MPLFNLRRNSKANAPGAVSAQAESADVVRRRAKHRLIGSAVLVLAGVLGFPLLFDTQPRPVASDIMIEIPAKGTGKPLAVSASTPVAPAARLQTPADKVEADASLAPKEEILQGKPAVAQSNQAQAAIKKEAKPDVKPDTRIVRAESKPAAKPAASDGSARAKAALDGDAGKAAATAEGGRMVVQVGAFAEAEKAREVRARLEKAGLKTYTQVLDTKDGKRIRVRVGPFANKGEADKAASKVKSLDLPASVLTL